MDTITVYRGSEADEDIAYVIQADIDAEDKLLFLFRLPTAYALYETYKQPVDISVFTVEVTDYICRISTGEDYLRDLLKKSMEANLHVETVTISLNLYHYDSDIMRVSDISRDLFMGKQDVVDWLSTGEVYLPDLDSLQINYIESVEQCFRFGNLFTKTCSGLSIYFINAHGLEIRQEVNIKSLTFKNSDAILYSDAIIKVESELYVDCPYFKRFLLHNSDIASLTTMTKSEANADYYNRSALGAIKHIRYLLGNTQNITENSYERDHFSSLCRLLNSSFRMRDMQLLMSMSTKVKLD